MKYRKLTVYNKVVCYSTKAFTFPFSSNEWKCKTAKDSSSSKILLTKEVNKTAKGECKLKS